MPEKEKGKTNPFMGELRFNEVILWSYVYPPLSFRAHLVRYLLRSLRTLVIMIGLFALLILHLLRDTPELRALFPGQSYVTIISRYIAMMAAMVMVFSLPLFAIVYRFSWLVNQRTVRKAYAVTNQRALSWLRGRISEVALDKIEPVSTDRRTVSFGKSFPRWNDLEEPADVVHLIEQSQETMTSRLMS